MWQKEWWDVASLQEGVSALVVCQALLGRLVDRAEGFACLCFQTTSPCNVVLKAFQEGSTWS